MRRFFGSLLVAMILGIGIGVYLGWVQFPAHSDNSVMCQLSESEREEYTLIVARGFRIEQDRDTAMRRLLPLNASNDEACQQESPASRIDNIPAWVQEVTERYLTRSADLRDICDLAALSAAFGRQIPGYADRPGTVCDQIQS